MPDLEARELKVLHLSGGDAESGAGRGAQWLHDGLSAIGLDSAIYFRRPALDKQLQGSLAQRLSGGLGRVALSLDWRLSVFVSEPGPYPYSLAPLRLSPESDVEAMEQADIVHIHWVSDGSFDIPSIAATGIPIVVTLRDMWPFTGGCGYDLGCGRYRDICAPCPALKPWATNWLARWRQQAASSEALQKVRFVAISDWLRDTAASSAILRGAEVVTIPNAIDHHRFFPVDSRELREKLGIGETEQVVVAGCLYLDSGYKNMQAVVDLWQKICTNGRRLVIFGQQGDKMRAALGDTAIFVGKISNDAEMRALYSLADVFVSPSLQEAFGKTAAEAGACAAPVVTFADSGTADVVRHGETGMAVPLGDTDALARAVDAILRAGGRKSPMGAAAREYCLANFASPVIARRYRELYQDMLAPDLQS